MTLHLAFSLLVLVMLTRTINASNDCEVSEWNEWSVCSTACGLSGEQQRTRTKTKQEKDNRVCSYPLEETRPCNRFCYNGGSPTSTGCTCQKGGSGQCCEYIKSADIQCDDCAKTAAGETKCKKVHCPDKQDACIHATFKSTMKGVTTDAWMKRCGTATMCKYSSSETCAMLKKQLNGSVNAMGSVATISSCDIKCGSTTEAVRDSAFQSAASIVAIITMNILFVVFYLI